MHKKLEDRIKESLPNQSDEELKKIKVFGNKTEYLIDKAPLNFKWIGFINLIFPNSKIIHCKRNAMDICWSSYKNTFCYALSSSLHHIF